MFVAASLLLATTCLLLLALAINLAYLAIALTG